MSTPERGARRKGAGYQATLLGGFTLLATTCLVLGDLATRHAIAQSHANDLLASLAQVVPAASHDNDLLAHPLTLTRKDGGTVTVYRALKGRQVTGVAYQITGQGYGGAIQLILGVDAQGRITGTRVLSHSETPGLGDRIEADRSDWILHFTGLSLGHPPAARWKVKKDGGVFDQFSGATITPRGVVAAIKAGLEFFQTHRTPLLAPTAGPATAANPSPEQHHG